MVSIVTHRHHNYCHQARSVAVAFNKVDNNNTDEGARTEQDFLARRRANDPHCTIRFVCWCWCSILDLICDFMSP